MTADSPALPAVPSARSHGPAAIDLSCRVPVLLMFFGAAVWLLVSSAFAFIGSLAFHAPYLSGDTGWLTYGRVQAVHLNALIYGFGIQAGLAVALWLMARLGRTPLRLPSLIIAGTIFWNAGVKISLLGILFGDSTGYEGLEIPGYASPILFVAYALIGIGALATFQQRRESVLHPSQWFLFAALFWFPWIYSTASLLLLFVPVRGVLQAVVSWWYTPNLTMVWFGFVGLAVLFYLIPKLVGRPLHSRYHAMIAFWLLALFGGWCGIPPSAPLPAWMPSLSTVAAVLTVVPLLAVAINLHKTLAGQYAAVPRSWPLALAMFSAGSYVLSGLLLIAESLPTVSRLTEFTLFVPARAQLFLYGFFALAVFAAIYSIAPRLLEGGLPSSRLVRVHAGCAVVGLSLHVFPLLVGGVAQGLALNNANVAPIDTLQPGLVALRLSTLGDLLLVCGHAALLGNIIWALVRCCRAWCGPVLEAAMRPDIVEASQ